MIIDFDREIAKEALELGAGKIVTREGFLVQIDDWNNISRSSTYPIIGTIFLPNGTSLGFQTWAENGGFLLNSQSEFDLVIEVKDEFLNGADS